LRPEVMNEKSIKRFLLEQQLLATLDHPGIARLIDAGALSDGTPYVVMELVHGQSILQHCRSAKLDVEQRLRLFQQVLQAVAHAHRNLVVHRDIKPSNVWVNHDGLVKLLDFGIAKQLNVVSIETATLDRYLTPAYAAPEQLQSSAVTTAADIYSLGALLYELLSGAPPLSLDQCTPAQAEQRISNQTPARMASLQGIDPAIVAAHLGIEAVKPWIKKLDSDLESIVQHALRKEPKARYQSVEAFAMDIDHYLANQPVRARAPSFWYHFTKLINRHRLVSATIAMAMLGTFLGVLYILHQSAIAERDRDRAQMALSILQDALSAADPMQVAGAELRARDMLSAAREKISPLAQSQPELFCDLISNVADIQTKLGVVLVDDPELEIALAIANTSGLDARLTQRVKMTYARRVIAAHQLDKAEAVLSDLESSAMAWNNADLQMLRAHFWLKQSEPEKAIFFAKRAVDLVATKENSNDGKPRSLEANSEAWTIANWQLSEAYKQAGKPQIGLTTLDQVLEQTKALGTDHPSQLLTRFRRVGMWSNLGKHDQAIAEIRLLIPLIRQRFGETSTLALAQDLYAKVLLAAKELKLAAVQFEIAADAYESSLGPQHNNTLRTRFNAASTLDRGEFDRERVDRHYQKALNDAVTALGIEHELPMYFRLMWASSLSKRNPELAKQILLPDAFVPKLAGLDEENQTEFKRLLALFFGPINCAELKQAQFPQQRRAIQAFCAAS
jgi:eukaryotic-like serine/threonine-protein kinase